MKRFYIFLILTLVTGISAVASCKKIGTAVMPLASINISGAIDTPYSLPELHKIMPYASVNPADYSGKWLWMCYDMTGNTPEAYRSDIDISIENNSPANITVVGLGGWDDITDDECRVKGTLDVKTGKVLIPNRQIIGKDSDGDITFYIKNITTDGQNLTILDGVKDVEYAQGILENGKITFDASDAFAIGNPEKENLGYYCLSILNTWTLEIEYTNDELWQDFTTGIFEDGWAIPGYGKDPVEYPWSVDIQKYSILDGVYRLSSPYIAKDSPIPGASEGYIVFDINDPDFVIVIPGIESGVTNNGYPLYMFNIEGFYVNHGFDKNTIMQSLGQLDWSSYSDGVATIYNCRFNNAIAPDKLYVWTDMGDKMKSKITFDTKPTGIEAVNVDQSSYPVEYYNLQGIRVERPTHGIYIRRQGTSTTKVIR